MKLGINNKEKQALINEFKTMVNNGMGKSIALDTLVLNHKEINSMWLRAQFFSFGWLI